MNSLERMNPAFQIKSIQADGTFSGYGSTFNNVDLGRDIVMPGAFDKTLNEHARAKTMPGMYFSHDVREPIGEWHTMATDEKGLLMEGQIWVGKGIPKAEQTYLMLKSNGPKGLSIGFYAKWEIDEGRKVRKLKEIDLKEVSPTPFPMNTRAVITSVKSLMAGRDSFTVREAEDALRDAGLSSGDAKQFVALCYSGFKQRDAESKTIEAALHRLNTILKS